ncbi:MAG: LysM peptidoglycan-binding domain-containing protein [Bacteroidia bacterium]|nr:LysM peptidoglycan-binding domain-containing protein [Bacteroidia bacterium]
MKITSCIKVLPIVVILLLFNSTVFSQVVVERSKDKVVISGIPYYIHLVKKGETAYSISKAYGITVEELTKENPTAVYGVNEGQALRIPIKPVTEVIPSEPVPVKKLLDETKFSYHKVLKGESLSSIAEKYGLTVRELRKENRDLRFPQVGDSVRVPGVNTAEIHEIEKVKTDTVAAIVEEPVIKMERPAGFTPVKELRGSLDVAVLLPFYLRENAERIEIDSSKSIHTVIKRAEDWIYPWSIDFVEMYEGILLAADTLRSLGLDINIYPYDIKSDTIAITELISSGKLAGMDLIIGPVYSYNLTAVAAYARDLGIPVVSPVTLINNSALSGNPTLFIAGSSLEIAQKALAKKISEYYDNNIVFIHSDITGIDEDVKRFKNLIFTELSYKLPFDEIKFKEIPFYSRSMFNNDSINRLSHALSGQFKNIVIIASEEDPVISETIQDIHGLSKKFDIKVFGYQAMRDIKNLDPKYFFDLDIMVYSPYWIDYTKSDVKQFNSDFRQKFLTEPLEKSYAWQGYDIAYYFLSGLAIYGKDFIAHPEMHYPDLLQTEYDFIRKEAGDGFENQKLFLVRYTKDYEVKLVEENKLIQQK